MNFAPRLSTCSRVSGRMSYAVTIAPSRFAVAIAWRPATPTPRMSTRDGGTVPAAVTSMGMNLGMAVAPRSAAAYPAAVAWEERASMDWARVVRGMSSIAIGVTPRACNAVRVPSLAAGFSRPITTDPSERRSASLPVSPSRSGPTVARMSIGSASLRLATTVAPASTYASSENPACRPAPDSMETVALSSINAVTLCGVAATLPSCA